MLNDRVDVFTKKDQIRDIHVIGIAMFWQLYMVMQYGR